MSDHITITPAQGTWVVRAGGAVLGETTGALELREGDHAPVIYFPRGDIAMLNARGGGGWAPRAPGAVEQSRIRARDMPRDRDRVSPYFHGVARAGRAHGPRRARAEPPNAPARHARAHRRPCFLFLRVSLCLSVCLFLQTFALLFHIACLSCCWLACLSACLCLCDCRIVACRLRSHLLVVLSMM